MQTALNHNKMRQKWCNAINRSSRKPAIKIKTHVNKQQRPRALPKIDTHAHSPAHAHSRRRSNSRGKINILSKTTSLNSRVCVTLLQPNGSSHSAVANGITPYLLRNKVLYPLLNVRVVESWGFEVVLSRSDQSGGAARPRGGGRRPRSVVAPRCTLLPRAEHAPLFLPNLGPAPPLTLTRCTVRRPPLTLPFSGALSNFQYVPIYTYYAERYRTILFLYDSWAHLTETSLMPVDGFINSKRVRAVKTFDDST